MAAWAAMGCGDSINCADYGAPSGQPQQVPQPKDLKQLDKKGPSQGDPARIQPETVPPKSNSHGVASARGLAMSYKFVQARDKSKTSQGSPRRRGKWRQVEASSRSRVEYSLRLKV